jgi:hypothetical protein
MPKLPEDTVMNDSMRLSRKSRVFATAALMILPGTAALFAGDTCAGTIDFTYRPVNNVTQFAVWVEDDTGAYLGTVFLTNFIGRRGGGNRTADANIDASNGNRPNAMPVWAYARGVVDVTYGFGSYYPPASTRPSYPADLDAVSGATPGPSIQKKTWKVSGLPCGSIRCRIEANQSFDFNAYHNYSFYRGQPSVVWTATVRAADAADSGAVLDYEGYGSTDGLDGKLRPPDSTITTAAGLLADMGGFRFKAVYTPAGTAVEEESGRQAGPEACRLYPNYPNPFNPSTVIRFQIREPGRVSLAVYDIRGRKIRNVVEAHYPAGAHAVRFDASGLAPGVYLCRIRMGDYTGTRKMAVVE